MNIERVARQILNGTPEPMRSGLRRILRPFKRLSLEQRVNIGLGSGPPTPSAFTMRLSRQSVSATLG